jgi:hypothetical protein
MARCLGLLHGLHNDGNGSRFVFGWRFLPSFEGVHDIPGFAVMSDTLLVERNIDGSTW